MTRSCARSISVGVVSADRNRGWAMNPTRRGGEPWSRILALRPLPSAAEAAALRGCSISSANAYAARHGFRWMALTRGRPATRPRAAARGLSPATMQVAS